MEIERLFQYGLPTVLLAALCYSLYRVGGWVARNLVIPIRDRHFAFLAITERAMEKMASAVECQTGLVTEIRDLLESKIRGKDFMDYQHARNHDFLNALNGIQLGIQETLTLLRKDQSAS